MWFFIVTEFIFLIFFMLFFYLPNAQERMEKYENRVGSLYSNINKTFSGRMMPLYFILKRIMFAVGVFYIKIELVSIMALISMINICIILNSKPYIDKSIYRLEIFNESLALIFFVSLQYFRDGFIDLEKQYNAGWFSLAILVFFMGTHMSINLNGMIRAFI